MFRETDAVQTQDAATRACADQAKGCGCGVYRCISLHEGSSNGGVKCKDSRTWRVTLVQMTGGGYTLWPVQDDGIVVFRNGRRSV